MAPSIIASSPTVNTDFFNNYDHVTWYVSNAKQAASFYVTRMGFSPVAYMGLETGSKDVSAHVVQCGNIVMCFKSALRSQATESSQNDLVKEIHEHVRRHGDGVKDVAFGVSDVAAVYYAAVKAGSKGLQPPQTQTTKEGSITTAIIKAYGDTTHTLVDRQSFRGAFFPGYRAAKEDSLIHERMGRVPLDVIDHCVANQDWHQMDDVCKYYERVLGFHRFWSVDDKTICTEYSALCSVVMASPNENIKMPVNEPAKGKKMSQIEEFVHFYDGPGVQHLALTTPDIIEAISVLRQRGLEFISVPKGYYTEIRKRLADSPLEISEDLDMLEELNIMIDFDDHGYLLQLFTKPLLDRPTVFIEIIQRHNFDGFGAGNFKSLFECIEREQAERGTL